MTRIADSWMDQISDNHTDTAVGMKKSAYEDYIIRNQDEGRLVVTMICSKSTGWIRTFLPGVSSSEVSSLIFKLHNLLRHLKVTPQFESRDDLRAGRLGVARLGVQAVKDGTRYHSQPLVVYFNTWCFKLFFVIYVKSLY